LVEKRYKGNEERSGLMKIIIIHFSSVFIYLRAELNSQWSFTEHEYKHQQQYDNAGQNNQKINKKKNGSV
jgi:hypothetical protein